MLYLVTAQVVKTYQDGSNMVRQVPTFLLCSGLQGIVDEKHAEQIALEVVNPLSDSTIQVYICVVKVDEEENRK